jgi:hypothetical protein
MESSGNTLVPKGEVFEEARRRDFAPGDDRFDRFRAWGLISELAPIPGTTQRGFTPSQAQRFFDLLSLCKQLGSKRPRASALAFWLCWHGATDVSPRLVCEHIERAVLSYLRFIKRQYGRRRVPMREAHDSERWRKAGIPWVKPFISEFFQSFVDNGLMLDILATMVGLALRMLFSDASFEAAATIFRRIAFLFGIKETKLEAMRTIWNIAREARQLFTVDERANLLLNAVREVNRENPSEIIQIVQDGRLVIGVMGAVFPIYKVSSAPALSEGSSETRVSVARNFPPAMCSVLAATRRVPHAVEMRQRLRAGDKEAAMAEFQQIRVIRDSIIAHISKEPKS